jgi:Putative collagen-binding domain of a collagenase
MTAIDKRSEPGPSFCLCAPICSFIYVLVMIALTSGSAFAEDASIRRLLKGKPGEVTQSNRIVTELTVQDGLKRTERSPIIGPLRASRNPNYFEDASGDPLILCGSHTWNTLQDWGADGSLQPLDFDKFVSFLKVHGHNFTLLWYTELPRFRGLPSTEKSPPDFTVGPHPWTRTGPGQATDGGLKFDLASLNQEYFDRLRARVKALHDAGIYVGVYLFTGEFQLRFRFRSDGYPFSGPNNVNGVDDGYRGGAAETGLASVTMTAPNAITDLQDAYVRKVIDTLNDLPNVLWIVSEEAPTRSTWWNSHLISLVRAYEKGKRYQHPIGYATLGEKPMDSVLYNSDADWVAPWAKVSPAKSCGTGKPACKVNINDSDHSYFGMWNETAQNNRNYAWENFMNGNQVLFMDPYLVYYPRENRNLCLSTVNGIGSKPDPRWENFRNNLGYILNYSRKLNLARVTPSPSICSTKFCLAQTPAAGAEYLIYAPSGGTFTMDLSAMPESRMLAVEWFNPATGEAMHQDPIKAGASSQPFTPPFSGDAVLYLVDGQGHR